jgi:tRNA threonylcarbamoyladenosine biosynthesis protein TsaE
MKEIIIKDIASLDVFAREFATNCKPVSVIGLVGDLGAGKTTFVQYFAKTLGVKQAVKSPTFILMQAFVTGVAAKKQGITRLCHVDAYRLKDYAELEAIGFGEFATDHGTVSVVEWADRVPELHKLEGYQELTFKIEPNGSRRITISH